MRKHWRKRFLSKYRLNTSESTDLIWMLPMKQHISSICRASFLELWRVASIRPYLCKSAAARLVAAMVMSGLDYVTQFSRADQQTRSLAWLQWVQNNAAQLVMKKKKKERKTQTKRKRKKEKKETRSRNTSSQGTSLATRKISLPELDGDSCLSPF